MLVARDFLKGGSKIKGGAPKSFANWGEPERAPHGRVVREPCLYVVCMFRTSYRKYILLQITETFCCNGKFIQKLFTVVQQLT